MEEQIQQTEVVKEGLSSLTPEGGNAMTSIQNAVNPGVDIVPNLIEAQDMAKNLSKIQLIEYAKSPQPDVIPAYIVTAELLRRKAATERRAKAPNFTVAEEAVASAEQGLINQMRQQQASNMPRGGYVRPREEITRETIMKEGIAPLPNPGNAMGQGGMAQGGIVGFIEGGPTTYTGQGAYMPQVKGKGAIADLLRYQDPVNPRNIPGLYQDFNLDQGPGMSMEDYRAQEAAILGPDRSSRIEDLQETFITPFDEEISKVETQITELGFGQKDPVTGLEIGMDVLTATRNPELYAKYNDLTKQKAALKQQRGLYFDDMSDAQIKKRREEGLPTGDEEIVKVDKSLTDKGGKESVDESLTDKDGKITDKTTVEEDFSFTRLNPEEEADAAIEYARKALGDDPSLATINEKLMKMQEDRAERYAKDRNMNVSDAYFRASREALKPGPLNVGNIISTGGSSFIEGKRRIDEAEEKAAMGDFGIESDLAKAAQARRDKLAGRGVDAYTRADQYNRALEQKERADATTRRGQDITGKNTLALQNLQYRMKRDDEKDARQLIQDEIKIEKEVLKGEIGNLPPEVLVYANVAIRPGMSEKKVELIKKSKEIVKQEVAKYIRRVRGQNTQTASNTVDYSSLN
jgi:hypothetical protein